MRFTVPLVATLLQPCAPLVLDVSDGQDPPDRGSLVAPGDDGRPSCSYDHPAAAEAERALATCAPGDAAWSDGRGHASIQDAIDAAPDGGAVLVCPGTHTGTVRVANRTLELSSLSGDPADTILAGPARVLEVESSDLTLSDLGLEDAAGSVTGGAIRQEGGSLRLAGVVSSGHEVTQTGGGVWFSGDVLSIADSTFEQSTAVANGGAVAIAAARCASVVDSRFAGNEASYSGGAVHADEVVDLLIVDSTFEGNTSATRGARSPTAPGTTGTWRSPTPRSSTTSPTTAGARSRSGRGPR